MRGSGEQVRRGSGLRASFGIGLVAMALVVGACSSAKKAADTAAATDTKAADTKAAVTVAGATDSTAAKAADTKAADTKAADTAAAAATSGNKPTIKIVENAWTASTIEAEMLKQIIEKNLGNKVEIVKIDENTMYAGLASGDLDAVAEIWPSGLNPEKQKFFDDGSVVNMGALGAVGKIGWWVPDYVLTQHPELASWEGFKKADLAKLFATAETGSKGRFLGTDPSYSQYDETIVKNLNLPLQVVFSGSEPATVAELDSRVAKKEPIIMYWWTPTAAVAKYNLKPVALPAHTKDCYNDKVKIACDYPEDPLFKAASQKLETKDAKVFSLIKNMKLTNDQQLALLPLVEIDKKPATDVVAEWLKANESTWKAWLA